MAFTFTVEDGTGLSTANAYISLAFANDHHSGRGNVAWAGVSSKKQQAIVRATDYIDKRFGSRFVGVRRNSSQALEWPRLDAFDQDEFLLMGPFDNVPRQLQKACAEYALIALTLILGVDADLAPNTGTQSGDISSTSVTVGPISESFTFARSSSSRSGQSSVVSDSMIPEYPTADLWIEELLKSTTTRRIKRA